MSFAGKWAELQVMMLSKINKPKTDKFTFFVHRIYIIYKYITYILYNYVVYNNLHDVYIICKYIIHVIYKYIIL